MARSEVPKSIKASLYIDGKPAEASIKNVNQVTRQLQREINQLTIGTEEWRRKMQQLAENRRYLRELRQEMDGVSGALGRIRAELGQIGSIAAGYLGFQFITAQFQGMISSNAKLSDSLADMRRVTGLTENGVLALNIALGKLDSRTSKGGLREIAIIAGKLGVAQGEILGFVQATDKLVVALGDELGNADQVTTTLGKILNVFDGKVTGDNITRLGNAMVKLANDGVASAGFISDFTQRVSGIAKTAGLSLPATLALGAGIEELGGRSESAATAMQKLFLSIAKDTPKAAKIAGVSLKEFNGLMASSPDKALLLYTKGLVANKAAFQDVTKALDDAGEEGARTIETITKLGQNTDFFTKKISDASTAIHGYNEINQAFELKNQTLGAQVEKLGKDFNALAQNKTLTDFFSWLIQATIGTVKWLKENSEAIAKVVKIVLVGTSAWVGYRTALMLTAAWQATVNGFLAVARVSSLLLALANAKLTGDTLRAAAAQRMLGLSMAANPFGAVLAIITALGTAYLLFSKKTETAAKIQEDLANIQTEALKRSNEEKLAISEINKQLNSENVTRNQKLILISKLRGMMGEHLKAYSDEAILAGKAKKSIDDYIASLERRTLAEAAQAQIRKLQDRNIELSDVTNNDNIGEWDYWKAGAMNFIGKNGTKWLAKKSTNANQQEIASNNARIKEIQATYGSVMFEQLVAPTATGAGSSVPSKDPNADKRRKEMEKLRDDLEKLEEQIYQNSLSKWAKEMAEIDSRYDELRKRAKGNKSDLAIIDKLQAQERIALEKKINEESVKEAEEAAKKIVEAKRDIFEATASEYDIEYLRTVEHYDKLIELAKKHSLDTTALEEARLKKLQALDDKKAGKKTPEELAEEEKKRVEKYEEDKKDFIIGAAQEASDAAFTIMSNSARAESDRKISALNKSREQELSNKNLTEQQKQEINARYDARIREERKRAFAAEQKAAIAQAIVNGALAATKVLAQTGVLSPFALPAIAIGTAAQIAIIASQKAPEYGDGGLSDEDPAGYVSRATLFNRSASGRPFVAGERGREWIAPNWMLQNPAYADIIGTLEVARKEKRMYAAGGFNGAASENTPGGSGGLGRLEELMAQMIIAQRQANNKKVALSYQEFERFGDDIERARLRQTA